MGQAARMTRKQRGNFLRSVHRMNRADVCEYGHFDCSNKEGGPCSDEAMALQASGSKESRRRFIPRVAPERLSR